MNGSPSAHTNGQYDGDGRCGGSSGPSGFEKNSTPSTRTRRWLSSSRYFRCHHSSRCDTVGMSSKLCTGGGELVPHSSVRASHGSGSVHTFLRLAMML